MTIEPGLIVAIFAAIIGSYAFTFTAWRATSNHVYTKLEELNKNLAALHVEVTNRLTAVETVLGVKKKK